MKKQYDTQLAEDLLSKDIEVTLREIFNILKIFEQKMILQQKSSLKKEKKAKKGINVLKENVFIKEDTIELATIYAGGTTIYLRAGIVLPNRSLSSLKAFQTLEKEQNVMQTIEEMKIKCIQNKKKMKKKELINKISILFSTFDTRNTGVLLQEDVRHLIMEWGNDGTIPLPGDDIEIETKITDLEVIQFINHLDDDGDGSVDVDEFSNWCLQAMTLTPLERTVFSSKSKLHSKLMNIIQNIENKIETSIVSSFQKTKKTIHL